MKVVLDIRGKRRLQCATMLDVLEKAGRLVGSVPELARRIGVTPQALYQWPRVPAERVLEIERLTGGELPRHEIRPDLYPPDEAAA